MSATNYAAGRQVVENRSQHPPTSAILTSSGRRTLTLSTMVRRVPTRRCSNRAQRKTTTIANNAYYAIISTQKHRHIGTLFACVDAQWRAVSSATRRHGPGVVPFAAAAAALAAVAAAAAAAADPQTFLCIITLPARPGQSAVSNQPASS